jgi:hypothetical protein
VPRDLRIVGFDDAKYATLLSGGGGLVRADAPARDGAAERETTGGAGGASPIR